MQALSCSSSPCRSHIQHAMSIRLFRKRAIEDAVTLAVFEPAGLRPCAPVQMG
jgi:hypothetical protein